MINDHDLLKLLLPEFLVEHLDILKTEQRESELHIHVEENNSIP